MELNLPQAGAVVLILAVVVVVLEMIIGRRRDSKPATPARSPPRHPTRPRSDGSATLIRVAMPRSRFPTPTVLATAPTGTSGRLDPLTEDDTRGSTERP